MAMELIAGGKRKLVKGRDALLYVRRGGWLLPDLYLLECYEDGELVKKMWTIDEAQTKFFRKSWTNHGRAVKRFG